MSSLGRSFELYIYIYRFLHIPPANIHTLFVRPCARFYKINSNMNANWIGIISARATVVLSAREAISYHVSRALLSSQHTVASPFIHSPLVRDLCIVSIQSRLHTLYTARTVRIGLGLMTQIHSNRLYLHCLYGMVVVCSRNHMQLVTLSLF